MGHFQPSIASTLCTCMNCQLDRLNFTHNHQALPKMAHGCSTVATAAVRVGWGVLGGKGPSFCKSISHNPWTGLQTVLSKPSTLTQNGNPSL
jgi:hypothetical protein